MRLLTVLLAALLLAGCASTRTLQPVATDDTVAQSHLPKERYHVRITTLDGKRLTATVFQPEIAAGETAPLIIASHGFGGFRAKSKRSFYARHMLTGEAALEAWNQGYWVVFYDTRGFGGSEGKIELAHPEYEVRDVSTVIDWSLRHLPAIRTLDNGEPAIGMIGESYSGGMQILASFRDPRLKAMVPIAPFYDLNAIAPHGHVKSNWAAILLLAGTASSRFDNGIMLQKPFRSGFSGTMNHEARQMLYQRSPAAYCDQGMAPQGDALIISGFRDTILPLDQGLKSQACFTQGGRDSRLLAIQDGHVLPWPIQKWSGFPPLFSTPDKLQCGDYQASMVDTVIAWWDEKLKGAERQVPDLCLTLGKKSSHETEQFPTITREFPVQSGRVHIPLAGLAEWLMIPVDVVTDVGRKAWQGSDLRFLKPNGGFLRPRFIPLTLAQEGDILSGIPKINVQLNGTASKASTRVFVGIGVQRAGTRRVHVASEQLTPLPAKRRYAEELPAVSMELNDGDRIGLVIYGYSWQYFFNPSYWYSQAQISGSVELPLVEIPIEKRARR